MCKLFKNKELGLLISCIFFFFLLLSNCARVYGQSPESGQKNAGEFFDIKVPEENYFFVKSALLVFGSNGIPLADKPEELEERTWDELLLSYEAFRRKIEVKPEELEAEITKVLQHEKVDFDWRADSAAFEKWAREKINEPAELFKNQLRHMLTVQKLRQQVMDGIVPQVKEEEARQEFRNEHNSLSVELAEFDSLKEARDFYGKAKKQKDFWEKERASRADRFRRPGFVSLEFLMDIWGFPRDAAYKMMRLKKGSIHPPEPIYKGYAVFLVLDTRPANEALYEKTKKGYYEQIRQKKKYKGLHEWLVNLRKQANIRIYKTKEGGQG
ncbi:MAG: hypothetical protein PHE18_05180 [Candidatus Omnitrophica bacterium]|nr:hypothetical protein [Candidatus Omnitrophota bacterium]